MVLVMQNLYTSLLCVLSSFQSDLGAVASPHIICCISQVDETLLARRKVEEQCGIEAPPEVFNILIDTCCKHGRVSSPHINSIDMFCGFK